MIREVRPKEYQRLGQLMVEIYAGLEGFPTPEEQPAYYRMLADIGRLTEQQDTQVLVALSPEGDLLGGVVYYGDMGRYGAGGTASQESNASGLRLLGVGQGVRDHGAKVVEGTVVRRSRGRRSASARRARRLGGTAGVGRIGRRDVSAATGGHAGLSRLASREGTKAGAVRERRP